MIEHLENKRMEGTREWMNSLRTGSLEGLVQSTSHNRGVECQAAALSENKVGRPVHRLMNERQPYLNFRNMTRFALTVTFPDEKADTEQPEEDDCSNIVKVQLNF